MYNLNYYANYVPYQSKRYNTEMNGKAFMKEIGFELDISIKGPGKPFLFLGMIVKTNYQGYLEIIAPLKRINKKIDRIRNDRKVVVVEQDQLQAEQERLISLYSQKLISHLAFSIFCMNANKLKEAIRHKFLYGCIHHLALITNTSTEAIMKKWGPGLSKAPSPFITRKQINIAFRNMHRKFEKQKRKFLNTGRIH